MNKHVRKLRTDISSKKQQELLVNVLNVLKTDDP